MSYQWTKYNEGNESAEKVTTGFHNLRITKVLHGKKSGDQFESANGDPQIMVVFSDPMERECVQMYTLSKRAGWALALMMDCAGVDMAKLEEQGIDVSHFEEPAFAKSKLIGLDLIGYVSWEPGSDGKEYSRVEPKRIEEVPAAQRASLSGSQPSQKPVTAGASRQKHEPITEDDIPF